MGGRRSACARDMDTHGLELLLFAAVGVGAEHLARRVDVVEAPAHGGAGRMLVDAQDSIPHETWTMERERLQIGVDASRSTLIEMRLTGKQGSTWRVQSRARTVIRPVAPGLGRCPATSDVTPVASSHHLAWVASAPYPCVRVQGRGASGLRGNASAESADNKTSTEKHLETNSNITEASIICVPFSFTVSTTCLSESPKIISSPGFHPRPPDTHRS
jgi:hypothetical protein